MGISEKISHTLSTWEWLQQSQEKMSGKNALHVLHFESQLDGPM